jgi:hypothetical protein
LRHRQAVEAARHGCGGCANGQHTQAENRMFEKLWEHSGCLHPFLMSLSSQALLARFIDAAGV